MGDGTQLWSRRGVSICGGCMCCCCVRLCLLRSAGDDATGGVALVCEPGFQWRTIANGRLPDETAHSLRADDGESDLLVPRAGRCLPTTSITLSSCAGRQPVCRFKQPRCATQRRAAKDDRQPDVNMLFSTQEPAGCGRHTTAWWPACHGGLVAATAGLHKASSSQCRASAMLPARNCGFPPSYVCVY